MHINRSIARQEACENAALIDQRCSSDEDSDERYDVLDDESDIGSSIATSDKSDKQMSMLESESSDQEQNLVNYKDGDELSNDEPGSIGDVIVDENYSPVVNEQTSGAIDQSEDNDIDDSITEPGPSTEKHGNDQHVNDLLLLALKLRYKLSNAAIGGVRNIINLLCGDGTVSSSNYYFDKQFAGLNVDVQFHYQCSKCDSYIGVAQEGILVCKNSRCNVIEEERLRRNKYFMYLPLKAQLKDLLENHDVADEIEKVFEKKKIVHTNIEDIFDGEMYKKAMSGLSKFDLSLSFNTDGVPIFNSSKCSLWPILATVNELPPKLRRTHVLLVGLWFGNCKPVMNNFFEPLVNEMATLREEGFIWTRETSKEQICSKVKLLVGVCDSVARPTLQGLTQFNGKYGCSYCVDEGVYLSDDHVRVYPYKENCTPRTASSTLEFAEQAVLSEKSVYGVKGPTLLSLVSDFNIISGLVPDYMHSILLGTVRQMTNLWFDTKNHSKPYYLGSQQKLIDMKLLEIRPPCSISRLPRSVTIRKYWKAHEWMAWFLYYSLPVLKSHLPKEFYRHWAILVESITILLGDSIKFDDLNKCEKLLVQFVLEFEHLYGLCNVSFNVHLCLHLTSSVLYWGPLWCHSAFVFESFNGVLLEMIRGTQAVPLQVCKTYLLKRTLPMFTKIAKRNACTAAYWNVLNGLTEEDRFNHAVSVKGVTCVGVAKDKVLNADDLLAVHTVAQSVHRSTVVQYYKRIIINGELVHSSEFCDKFQRNSHVVELNDRERSLFTIKAFICADFNGTGAECYAIGGFFQPALQNLCSVNPVTPIHLSGIVSVRKEIGRPVAIRACRIYRKCIFISNNMSTVNYICRQPNVFEYCS